VRDPARAVGTAVEARAFAAQGIRLKERSSPLLS